MGDSGRFMGALEGFKEFHWFSGVFHWALYVEVFQGVSMCFRVFQEFLDGFLRVLGVFTDFQMSFMGVSGGFRSTTRQLCAFL